MTFKTSDWHGLYGDGWKGEIVPDAFTHPAKFSRALIRHIYQHCAAESWLKAGDSVIDPFGGVALGALDALRLGLHWAGVELEPRFVDLGQQNIAAWNARYSGHFRTWGSAALLQGDSRQLAACLAKAQLAVSSPPYATTDQNYRAGWAHFHSNGRTPLYRNDRQREAEYGKSEGQLAGLPATDAGFAAAVGSPPYLADEKHDHTKVERDDRRGKTQGRSGFRGQYGKEPGQLAAMPAGSLDAAISSPPFLQSGGGVGVKPGAAPGSILSDPHIYARHAAGNSAAEAYGVDPANLGNLPAGEFAAAVSSPPYEKSLDDNHYGDGIDWAKAERTNQGGGRHQAPGKSLSSHYGTAAGNIGGKGSEDFWSAARAIVEQTYAVLTPGGHACWVVKNFVKDRQIVPFTDQWRQLCEAVGFVTLHEHRAWLVEDHGTQMAHDGNHKAHRTERKSFFRRLAEKKGSPRIDWELVLCMVKPE